MYVLLLAVPSLLPAQPAAAPRTATPPLGFSSERLARIEKVLQSSVDAREFAGINAAIQHKGRVVWNRSFGYQDLEARTPMRADTIFRIYSMTKPIASAAVMMLYEEGKFLLDDPVSKFIPGMDKVKVLAREDGSQYEVVPLKRPMTIRHLLTHTSGLSNNRGYQDNDTFSRKGTLRDMAAKLPQTPLAHQPGEAWRYGQSIDVLGYLVEAASGKPFDVFLRERIFEPLAMKDTGFHVPRDKVGRLSKVYQLNASGALEPGRTFGDPTVAPAFFSGGGGLYSTVADYLRFCQMLANGGVLEGKRLLSRTTVDYMFRNHVPLSVIPPEGPNGRRGYGFGLGGAVLMDAAAAETLSVDGEFNWGGAAGTYFWIDRKTELIGVWMVQRPPFTPPPGKRFKVLVYQALE